MKQLTNSKIFVEQVSQDATNIKITSGNKISALLWYDDNDEYLSKAPRMVFDKHFKLIGCITADKKFDFDCFDYIKSFQEDSTIIRHYWDYIEKDWMLKTKEDGFLSMLKASGVYLVNPFGKEYPDNCVYNEQQQAELHLKQDQWQQAQENTLRVGNKWLFFEGE